MVRLVQIKLIGENDGQKYFAKNRRCRSRNGAICRPLAKVLQLRREWSGCCCVDSCSDR